MIGHILLAIAIQIAGRFVLKSWAAGAAVAIAWALAREITQAEYRWIEAYGAGLRANMPWWGGLDPAVWRKPDAWLDWIVPSAVVVLVALAAGKRRVPEHS